MYQVRQKLICSITPSMKDPDFLFDVVWFCLLFISYFVQAACLYTACFLWTRSKLCVSEKGAEGCHWKTNFKATVFSLDTVIGNFQMQAEQNRGKWKKKAKLKLTVFFLPVLFQNSQCTTQWGVSLSCWKLFLYLWPPSLTNSVFLSKLFHILVKCTYA